MNKNIFDINHLQFEALLMIPQLASIQITFEKKNDIITWDTPFCQIVIKGEDFFHVDFRKITQHECSLNIEMMPICFTLIDAFRSLANINNLDRLVFDQYGTIDDHRYEIWKLTIDEQLSYKFYVNSNQPNSLKAIIRSMDKESGAGLLNDIALIKR